MVVAFLRVCERVSAEEGMAGGRGRGGSVCMTACLFCVYSILMPAMIIVKLYKQLIEKSCIYSSVSDSS